MSWLAELAGKAENAIVNFDNNTANIFTKKDNEMKSNVSEYPLHSSASVPSSLEALDLSSGIVNSPTSSKVSDNFHESLSYGSTPRKLRDKIVNKSYDQSFITFLNEGENKSSNKGDGSSHVSTTENISANLVHSRQSSLSSGSSYLAVSGRDTPAFTSLDIESSTGSGGSGSSDPYVRIEPPTGIISAMADSGNEASKKKNESLQSSASKESSFLRKEVSSLNQEMTQMLKRTKEAEKESQRIKDKYSILNTQQKYSESLLRDMQESETRLQRLGREKDEKIYSIQVKEKDLTERMQERDQTNKELHEQNQRLLEGASMSTNLHSEVEVALKARLDDTELKLKNETVALAIARDESTNRIIQLEEDQKTLTRDLSDLNRKRDNDKTTISTLNSQIAGVKNDLSSTRHELEDYKTKAGRILQSKEKLIASLKEERGDAAQDELLEEELNQIKNERDLLREELIRSSERVHQLSGEVAEAEAIAHQEAKNTFDQLSQIQQELEKEHSDALLAQDELKQMKQERRSVQEELTRQKICISSRLNQRDEEICRLQKQIAHKQSSSSGITELENRIHGLTESLILKQTSIESLSTEKHTLQMQMEKIQLQYQESQKLLNKESIIDFTPDELRSRGVPTFLMESPFDGGVTRRVKKAYGTLDKFSIGLGVFLRRYPIARVFVILYMGLLHVWVMIVLLTYSPEIHGSDFEHPVNLGSAPRGP